MQQKLEDIRKNITPITINLPGQGKQIIFYEDSEVLRQLQMFPVFQLILIGVFLVISYLIFSTFRKAEQNQVWVGMSKETAHQLGTPISSLNGWINLLREEGIAHKEELINELEKDVKRLEIITERFSKIGSAPVLDAVPIYEVMSKAIEYLRNRSSKQVQFEVTTSDEDAVAMVNIPLFEWVIENLCKNAIDAMSGAGVISAHISTDADKVFIDIKDTGKGIPASKFKTVFKPGYTTKKRGWGLGLSLAKRIIEEYHRGKIFVKESSPEKGTNFRIVLRGNGE